MVEAFKPTLLIIIVMENLIGSTLIPVRLLIALATLVTLLRYKPTLAKTEQL